MCMEPSTVGTGMKPSAVKTASNLALFLYRRTPRPRGSAFVLYCIGLEEGEES